MAFHAADGDMRNCRGSILAAADHGRRISVLTYQVEPWSKCLPEMMSLWPAHWDEVAGDKDRIVLDPDLDRYAEMERKGQLQVVTARKDGELVGYAIWIVGTLLHYRTVLAAISDIYWLRPDCRNGFAGIRLFKESEKHLKSLGVKKLFSATKCCLDIGPVFERLDWSLTERKFCKYIGT